LRIESRRFRRPGPDGGQLLLRTLIVKRLLESHVLAADEKCVGVLLPPSVGGVLVNAALPLSGRIPVNLNYTAFSRDAQSLHRGGRHQARHHQPIVHDQDAARGRRTGRLSEDFKDKVTKLDKAVAAIQAYCRSGGHTRADVRPDEDPG